MSCTRMFNDSCSACLYLAGCKIFKNMFIILFCSSRLRRLLRVRLTVWIAHSSIVAIVTGCAAELEMLPMEAWILLIIMLNYIVFPTLG